MKRLQINCLMIVIAFVIVHTNTLSQSLVPDTASSPAENNVIKFYNAALSEQLHLYNGKEYKDYAMPFDEGSPYFINTGWSNGTVDYDGKNYKDVSLFYNVVNDDVIIADHNKALKILLIKEKVAGFSLLGHSFLNLSRDSLFSTDMHPGFYDVLATGKISLLARRTKSIKTTTKQKVEFKVYENNHFYVKKNRSYFPVYNKSSLLEQFGERKKEMEQYMKQNRFKFNSDAENVMIKTIEYYNQLMK